MTSTARAVMVGGPSVSGGTRYGRAGLLVKRIVLRLIRPFSSYQRQLDWELLAVLEALDVQRRAQESQIARFAGEFHDVQQALDGHQRRIDEIEDRAAAVPYMADARFELLERPVAGKVLGYTGGGDVREDSYMAFEDIFRGPEERVRELQRVYLQLLDGREPVLDLGCGRGEFLDLLHEAGADCTGVDTDTAMVEHSRAKGHRVEQADGIAYLARLPERSLGAIFSAQVIEHLPYEGLLELLRLAPLKLAPGGILILETVNPHDPQALKTFWVDPTHRNPLFPEVMLTLCRISGFESAYVFHPDGSGDYARDRLREGAYTVVATVAGVSAPKFE